MHAMERVLAQCTSSPSEPLLEQRENSHGQDILAMMDLRKRDGGEDLYIRGVVDNDD